MGATAWNYFTPYREDVGQALKELQQRVFANGEYGKPSQRRMSLPPELLAELPPDQRKAFDELASLQDEFIEQGDPEDGDMPKPATIGKLREQCAEEGTHSILDIHEISDQPAFRGRLPNARVSPRISRTPRQTTKRFIDMGLRLSLRVH